MQPASNPRTFSPWNFIFHHSAKVFSLESFPLYGNKRCTHITITTQSSVTKTTDCWLTLGPLCQETTANKLGIQLLARESAHLQVTWTNNRMAERVSMTLPITLSSASPCTWSENETIHITSIYFCIQSQPTINLLYTCSNLLTVNVIALNTVPWYRWIS